MAASNNENGSPGDKIRPPLVSIGASAGGVTALQTFFDALPGQTGAAFVVVVHLDPEHASDMARIIASRTSMPVIEVVRDQPIEPDKVYVIPPNRRLLVSADQISSAAFEEPRGQRAPIDQFFRSVADQHGDGFAIILTGGGADGTVGVKAIKEAGGLILVQDPTEAEYPSMPQNAIASGVADFVLPVKDIARRLPELIHNKQQLAFEDLASKDEETLRRILLHLRQKTGHDFSHYKRATVGRRLARRMQVTHTEAAGLPLPSAEPSGRGSGAACRPPDLGHQLLPRCRRLRGACREGDQAVARPTRARSEPSHLGAGLRDRRRGLFHRDAAARTVRGAARPA
jgi:two-component system, chemotaxis family, CheB/CheR fusion protein